MVSASNHHHSSSGNSNGSGAGGDSGKVKSVGSLLTQTSSSSLLGFVVNDRLTPTDHVSKLLKKVATNTRLLLAVRHLMNSHLSLKFYHHFIHSYLTYGTEIYFPLATSKQTTSLTILQKKALKYALSLPRRYPTRLLEHKSVLLLPKLACYFSAILGYKVLSNSCLSSDLFKTTPSKSTIITRHTFKLPLLSFCLTKVYTDLIQQPS